MKWLPAENELGREQREFLNHNVYTENNEKISGFPGSGKTVVLLYTVVYLRRKNPNSKILIVEFTHALIKMQQAAIDELSKEEKYQDLHLENIEILTYFDFMNRSHSKYDCIVCDEVQDIPEKVIQAMKQRAKRVIVGGDANQSIYAQDPRWKLPPCSWSNINTILSPNETNLTIIYRLTKQIIGAINTFLPSMKILHGRSSMVKQHIQIRLWKSSNIYQETVHIMNEAISRNNGYGSVAVLVPTHKMVITFANQALATANKPMWEEQLNIYNQTDFESLNKHLKENGIPMQYVANGYGDFTLEKMITLTTYHSSKGLDFDVVMLPFCNGAFMPKMVTSTLFMVAMTRSRKDLFISYSSETPSPYIQPFASTCLFKDWTNEGEENHSNDHNNSNDDIFDF